MRTCAKQQDGGHGWSEKLPAELYNKNEVKPEKQFCGAQRHRHLDRLQMRSGCRCNR